MRRKWEQYVTHKILGIAMVDITTKYMGLSLANPIIVGSSGLTDSVNSIKQLEDNGAAAVVLKSIYEEEIYLEYDNILKKLVSKGYHNLEDFDYYDFELKAKKLNKYINMIEDSKRNVSIPVIASINCLYSHEWSFFSKQLESAGADALELNMFFQPSDFSRSSEQIEAKYFEIIEKVKAEIHIPLALKISPYFSNLGQMLQKFSNTGISALVLFNRFFSPDFDIEKFKVIPTHVLSTPSELANSLRWISIMSERVSCDLAASTGVHDGEGVIKQILAGAKAVQVVSSLYKNGKGHIQEMINRLGDWMNHKGYVSLDQFRGKMSQAKSSNPAIYERVQFMKYFTGR